MATPTPDLSTLTSSAQVFSSGNTLPQIRAIHKQLHVAIDDKAARLRTQVGGSYRELLGTADAIVRMRGDMDTIQTTLGRMGARCGRTVVATKVKGLGRFVVEKEEAEEGQGDDGAKDLGPVARAKMLDACVLAVGRLLKTGGGAAKSGSDAQTEGRLVIAARVCVLGQLLIRSFGESVSGAVIGAAVDISKKSLRALRGKLLRRIRAVLENVCERTNREGVLEALCAYSMVKNSGARDVLHHFLSVRAAAMATVFEVEEHERERSTSDVVDGLELYTRTLLDVQYLVPHKLMGALAALKKDVLLSDASLRELENLRLDIYERWCGDQIQQFKPSMRHDDLEGKKAKEMLMSWAKKGGEVLLHGLEKTLERTTEFRAIVDMRTDVLQLWIRDGGKAKGFDPSVMLDKLRQTINAHVMVVLTAKVNKLRLVGSEVAATLESWEAGVTETHESLWDHETLDMDLHNGASQLTQDVITRLYGRSHAVARAVTGYKSWRQVVDDVEGIVEQLKRQRWDNDVDEIEDEETIEERQQALSKDDPQKLRERLHTTLGRAFADLDKQLSTLWNSHEQSPHSGRVAMYLLRVLRDIRGKLPTLEAVQKFGLSMVPSLQEKIASTVARSSIDQFATGVLARRTVVGRSLWEGDPELPTSPSPDVFRFLRGLTMAMGDAGTDLWSPAAVSVLKRHLGKRLAEEWQKALVAHYAQAKPNDGAKNQEANESSEDESNEKDEEKDETGADADTAIAAIQQRDLLVQWLFDVSMLRSCIGSDELKELESSLWETASIEGEAGKQHLVKTSQDYWKRVTLLFGLLS